MGPAKRMMSTRGAGAVGGAGEAAGEAGGGVGTRARASGRDTTLFGSGVRSTASY